MRAAVGAEGLALSGSARNASSRARSRANLSLLAKPADASPSTPPFQSSHSTASIRIVNDDYHDDWPHDSAASALTGVRGGGDALACGRHRALYGDVCDRGLDVVSEDSDRGRRPSLQGEPAARRPEAPAVDARAGARTRVIARHRARRCDDGIDGAHQGRCKRRGDVSVPRANHAELLRDQRCSPRF